MGVLTGKKVLLGVTAGIAAYKAPWLVRSFIKAGAHVKVIMTPDAREFVTPLTLRVLSKNPVWSTFTNEEDDSPIWNNHVELGLWADVFVIAPATANTLAKMASGTCDNLLLATYLSAKCPVFFAPAMDLDMHGHQSTQANFDILKSFGNIMIASTSGELASGLNGLGRMAEPDDIVQFIEQELLSKMPLRDKKVLITAGPTYEAIDPVRFIGNHSSGKMGVALANRAIALGAEVTLVLGPCSLTINEKDMKVLRVTSAQEMFEAVKNVFISMDIIIAAAAVADFKPAQVASEKIKKATALDAIKLVPTIDILKYLGERKERQYLVGFALETENELENAKAKLINKNLDLIVLNSLNDVGAGFKSDTNKVTLIDRAGTVIPLALKTKEVAAGDILETICTALNV